MTATTTETTQASNVLLTEVRDHVLILTLNRPQARNAFNAELSQALSDALDRFEQDPELRVGILTGAGGSFSAGMDLKALVKGEQSFTKKRGGFGIMTLPPDKPLIAAIEGYAVAGGLELALCCDLIVATEDSKLGLPEVKRGLVAVGGALFRLPRLIPYHVVMELALTGETHPAARFHQLGLVNRVVPPGQALAAAQQLAAPIAAFPQTCMRGDRASVLEQDGLDEAAALANEFTHGLHSLAVDALPGAARFAAGEGRHGAGV